MVSREIDAGTCVVASNISESADLLEHRKHGLLVPANNCGAMSQSLLKVFADEELKSDHELAGSKRAREFSWEQITKRYIDVYEDGLSRSAN